MGCYISEQKTRLIHPVTSFCLSHCDFPFTQDKFYSQKSQGAFLSMGNLHFILLSLISTFLLLVSSTAVVLSHLASTSTPTWLPGDHKVDWAELFPGGLSPDAQPTYVARAKVDNNGVAVGGVSERAFALYYHYTNGKIGSSSRFELLAYPRGSLIWVEATTQNIVECNRDSWFPGGNQSGTDNNSSSTLYICRGWVASEVAIGQLLGNGTGGCEVVADDDGGGQSSSTLENFDILISNTLLDTSSSSCSRSSVPPVAKWLDGHDNPAVIRWVPSTQVNRPELSPAGVEYGWPFYIGRRVTSGGTLVGKARFFKTRKEFTHIFQGEEYSNPDKFEFLLAPPGVLSWVQVVVVSNSPNKNNSQSSCIPQNAFVGGNHSVEGIFHVCRVWLTWPSNSWEVHRLLVIGRLRRGESGNCEIRMKDSPKPLEYPEFDVLVVNNDESSCPTDLIPETPTSSSSNQVSSTTAWFLLGGGMLVLLLIVVGIGVCLVVRFGGGWKTGGYRACTRRFQNSVGSGGGDGDDRERNMSYAKGADDGDDTITTS